ncbi:MAG: cytochrome c biogenesis protein CcsA [Myxococcales bacterium]|nr:cytochrome c biogenesis protein CcsA [Myxococcales bacterium]
MSLQLIQIGFPLLSIAIVSGWLHRQGGPSILSRLDYRLLSSYFVWLLYAALLHFRLVIGWRGRRLAMLTVFGLVAALVSVALNVTRAKIAPESPAVTSQRS